ncbi:MAG: Ni/Fe-hydrogenase, b-type cytochrome subunit [Myxococcales bacterium]|nr:Ni/Fe-hydrogenase, b-type cytochrome subunit [Myxococcales bacterium]
MAAPAVRAKEASEPSPRGELHPVYVWDRLVRATHWLIAISIVVLAATGVYLGRPFVAAPGAARDNFVMGTVKIVHAYAALVFTLCVVSRVIWMFLGPRVSGWREFVPVSRRRRRDMFGTFKFYVFLRPSPPPSVGHNPLAGFTYVAVFGLYFLMIATGFALYSVSSHSYMEIWQFLLPIFHGAQGARWLHHVTMWLLLGFAVHHVFSAHLVASVEKNGTLDSIFTGYKYLPKQHETDDE